jgi:hypothetical protein
MSKDKSSHAMNLVFNGCINGPCERCEEIRDVKINSACEFFHPHIPEIDYLLSVDGNILSWWPLSGMLLSLSSHSASRFRYENCGKGAF